MPRASKRQKISEGLSRPKSAPAAKGKSKKARAPPQAPLGAEEVQALVADDAAKDDEERRLESILFGTPYVPTGKGKAKEDALDETFEDADINEDAGRELENMLDTDLFFFDDNAPPSPVRVAGNDDSEDRDAEDDDDEPPPSRSRDSDVGSSASESESDLDDDAPAPSGPSRAKPAWEDPDDARVQVSLASDTRLRKLRTAAGEDALAGRAYEARLRAQFARTHPPPAWAARAKAAVRKRARGAASDATSDEDADADERDAPVEDLLASAGGLKGTKKRGVFEKGTLAIDRLRDANAAARAEGAVRVVRFHPSAAVPLLCVASSDRRVRLFNIDGHANPHLQTVHVPELPVSTAHFHPRGGALLLAGPRPFFTTLDLGSGAAVRSPRGLWGRAGAGDQELSLARCAFSPDGAALAVAGRGGTVHLVDWAAGAGGAQVVGSVKANTPVKALWWAAPPGAAEGAANELMTLGADAEVYVWDVRARRCVRRWKDDGAFGACVMEGDSAGRHLAIGSTTGFVNVYGADAVGAGGAEPPARPRTRKALGQLTTAISALRFSGDGQLLAIASDDKQDQLRMIHTASLTAFSNWPTAGTPLGRVTDIDFAPAGGFVAVGNHRGRALLYQLRDYAGL